MLVFGSVHVGPEFIGSSPERFFNVVDHEVVHGHKVKRRLWILRFVTTLTYYLQNNCFR